MGPWPFLDGLLFLQRLVKSFSKQFKGYKGNQGSRGFWGQGQSSGYKWIRSSGSSRGRQGVVEHSQGRSQISFPSFAEPGLLPRPWPDAPGVNIPIDQNWPWPNESVEARPSHSGKGISPNPPMVSNPVSTIHTSYEHGNVTSTRSFPSGKPPSVVPEVKSLSKTARAKDSNVKKSKKSQRQALLAALEELENDESEDETGTCAPSPLPSANPALDTGDMHKIPSSSTIQDVRGLDSIISSSLASPLNSSSTLNASSDMDKFSNDMLSWDSYKEFVSFCSHIGIIFQTFLRLNGSLIKSKCNKACLRLI